MALSVRNQVQLYPPDRIRQETQEKERTRGRDEVNKAKRERVIQANIYPGK